MSHLINIYLEPAKVYADLKEKPSFWVPLLLVAAVSSLSVLLYFMQVDPAWFADQQVLQMKNSGRDISAAEIDQAMKVMPGARTMGYFMAPSTLIMVAVVYLLMALYYLLAGKVTGNAVSFRHGLALTAWSSMPLLLGSVVVLVGILTSSPQTSFESLQLLNVDPLLVQLPLDNPWSTLAKSFSLLNFWAWFLAAMGWKLWFRTGWGQALAVVLLPSLVIYGVMIAVALL